MKKIFEMDRSKMLESNKNVEMKIFTEELIKDLPELFKNHLRICGYMNKQVPINANVYWSETWLKMAPGKKWEALNTTQFNSVNPIGRVSLMKFLSMPVIGRDLYREGYGEMKGKLFNLIKVVFDNSKETAQSALITAFSEFLFVPGYILLDQVKWEQIDQHSVRGILKDHDIEVSGVFRFDDDGLFTHFETHDRYYSTGKNAYKKVKFSAIVESYKIQNNIKVAEKVKIVWHLPEGDYDYYKGIVDKVDFNVKP